MTDRPGVPKRLVIYAGTTAQAKDYARAHGIQPRDYIIADRLEVIMGLRGNEIVFVGTCTERPDFFAMVHEFRVRDFRPVAP